MARFCGEKRFSKLKGRRVQAGLNLVVGGRAGVEELAEVEGGGGGCMVG